MTEREGRPNAPADDDDTDVTEDPFEAVDEGKPYIPPDEPVHPAAPRPMSGGNADEALAERVRQELAQDPSTSPLRLDVAVRDGVATLRGTVGDLQDLDDALAVAGRVPGIEDVVDELDVEG